jgi:energy-coupling factor transporter ATP-binding protein EcfA2
MNNAPTSPDGWQAHLLPVIHTLLLLVIAVCPPLAAGLNFSQSVTQNPLLFVALIVLYEILVLLVGILSGIWQQLKDSWVKRIAAAIDSAVQNALSRYYHHYRDYFCYEHRDIDLRGMSIQGEYTLDLEDVLVELRIDPKPAHEASPDPLRLPEKLLSESQTIWDYLRAKPLRGQHLAILGPPGSGKTTLLRHLGLTLLRYRQMRYPKGITRKLPVLLFLRDHSITIKDNPDYALRDAIRAHTHKWPHKMPQNWIEHRLKRGHCLILLDGLDEVADIETRHCIVKWIREQTVAYGKNRFILTSRPFGYSSNPISGLNVLEVQPFTWEQITQFVEHWYLTNEIKSALGRNDLGVRMKAREGAIDLLRRLRGNAALFALESNPLLLTMTATVHRYRGSLPGTRATLYKEICEVLLGKRREVQGVKQDLRADQRQLVLQELAYHMMNSEQRDITEHDAVQTISHTLQEVSNVLTPLEFLRGIEQNCGILLEREQGLYTFAHKTFQEYLAAVHIREQSLEKELTAQVELDWWHETIRLYSAQADASTIISACLIKEPPSVLALTLALECLEEARNIQKDVKQRLDFIIEQGIEDLDPNRRRVVAEALLARRLSQMQPLNEQTEADSSLVTCAEYQLFLDEQRAQGNYLQPDHWREATFPSGQGRVPALGLRWSDAQSFCSWLTKRDVSVWHYRLPHIGELEHNIIKCISSEEIGYWANENGPPRIIWLRGRPPQGFNVQIDHALDRALDPDLSVALDRANANARVRASISTRALASALDRTLASALDHALDRARDRAVDRTLASASASDLALILSRDLYNDRIRASALSRGSDLDLDLYHDRDYVRARTRASDLAWDLASATDLAWELANTSDRARARARSLDLAIVNALKLALILSRALERALDLARALALDLALERDRALDIYFTLFLLRERINGRLSAYEGILLVRERREEQKTS